MQWVLHQMILDWRMLIEALQISPEDMCKLLHILLDRMNKRPDRHIPESVDGDQAKGLDIEEARRREKTGDWSTLRF